MDAPEESIVKDHRPAPGSRAWVDARLAYHLDRRPQPEAQPMPATVLKEGRCRCIKEPNCAGGMEGFNACQVYRYQLCEGRIRAGRYCRVWHDETYYETCGPVEFRSYFEPLED
jgi:hypothetical protein